MLGSFWGERAGRVRETVANRWAARRRGPAVRRGHRPVIEGLESRVVLSSTDVWTGATSGNWSVASNWQAGTVPVAGDALVFPSTATNFTTVDDLAGGTSFSSITIEAPSYSLAPASNANTLTLTGGFAASYTGISTYSINTTLTVAATPVSVSPGTELDIKGALSETGGPTGTVGLSVSGGGTVDLFDVNSFTGATTVASGTSLLVDGTIADVQDNGGTLGGNGSVGAVTSVGGTISPGHSSPSVLTANGSVTLDSASSFVAILNGTTPGNGTTGYTQLAVNSSTGLITLGSATLNVTLGSGYTPAPSQQLTIIKNGTNSPITGVFAGHPEGGAVNVGNSLFRISYLGTNGAGRDVVLSAVNAPSTTTLLPIVGPVTYGQPFSMTAQVNGSLAIPTGTVEFFDGNPGAGGTEIASAPVNATTGQATTSVNNLAVSPTGHQIYAVFVPTATDFTYAGSTSSPVALTVNPATLTVSGVTAQNKEYDTTTLAVLDTSAATLSGVLFNDQVSLNTLNAIGTFASPNVGTSIPVTVSGLSLQGPNATNYVLAQPTGLMAAITPAPLSLIANNQTMNYGGPVPTLTYTAKGLLGTDTTSVLLTQPTLSTTATSLSPPGTYPINITGGTAQNYSITDVPGVLNVVTSTATTTTLSTSQQYAAVGSPVTFTATVHPASLGLGQPTGQVAFVVDNALADLVPLNASTGQATFTTSSLSYGAHAVTAVFLANAPFQSSQSSTLTQYVTASGTQPFITLLPIRRHGRLVKVEIRAEVQPIAPGTGYPPGSVTFFINGRAFYQSVPLVNGVATLMQFPPKISNKYIYVRYNGNPSYFASASSNYYVSLRALAHLPKTLTRAEVRRHDHRG
ncbi:MAG: Ig-like domain repeat protein [Isosphaeraceae bacterium]